MKFYSCEIAANKVEKSSVSKVCKAIIFAQEHGYYDDELAEAVRVAVSKTFMDNIKCAKKIAKLMKPGVSYFVNDICEIARDNHITLPEPYYFFDSKIAAIMRDGAMLGLFDSFRFDFGEYGRIFYTLA